MIIWKCKLLTTPVICPRSSIVLFMSTGDESHLQSETLGPWPRSEFLLQETWTTSFIAEMDPTMDSPCNNVDGQAQGSQIRTISSTPNASLPRGSRRPPRARQPRAKAQPRRLLSSHRLTGPSTQSCWRCRKYKKPVGCLLSLLELVLRSLAVHWLPSMRLVCHKRVSPLANKPRVSS